MQRPVLAALLLLWYPAFAAAQEGAAKPPATQQDPETAYKGLVKAAQQAMTAWQQEAMQKVKAAQDAGEPIPAIAMNPPTKEFIGRAQELAAQYAGTDDAIRFLTFVCKNASNERNAVRKAIDTLHQDHAESALVGAALGFLEGAVHQFGARQKVMDLLDAVVERNKNDGCVAQALIVRGTLRLQAAESDEDRKAAEQDLRKVATVTKDEALQKQAKDALFEIEHLQVGCTAPDIAAKDTDGVEFKLSDYRGKVVLLDFWGFW